MLLKSKCCNAEVELMTHIKSSRYVYKCLNCLSTDVDIYMDKLDNWSLLRLGEALIDFNKREKEISRYQLYDCGASLFYNTGNYKGDNFILITEKDSDIDLINKFLKNNLLSFKTLLINLKKEKYFLIKIDKDVFYFGKNKLRKEAKDFLKEAYLSTMYRSFTMYNINKRYEYTHLHYNLFLALIDGKYDKKYEKIMSEKLFMWAKDLKKETLIYFFQKATCECYEHKAFIERNYDY